MILVFAIIVGVVYVARRGSDSEEGPPRAAKRGSRTSASTGSLILLEQTIIKAIKEGDAEVELVLAKDGEVPMFNKLWRVTIRAPLEAKKRTSKSGAEEFRVVA